MIAILTGVALGISLNYLYQEFNSSIINRKNQKSSIKALKSRVSIKDHLDALREDIGANRVSIIKYDDDMVKSNMIYESVKEGTPEIMPSFQNINSMVCLPMLLELEQRGFTTVDKNSKDDIKRLHNTINVKTSFKYRINKSISEGCLVVAFSHDHELTPNEGEQIIKTIKEIKPLLCSNK